MYSQYPFIIAFLVFGANVCIQAAEVTVLDTEIMLGQRTVEVPVFISGSEDIAGLSIAFSIGTGGELLGGTETIEVVSVRYLGGTIFDSLTADDLTTFNSFPLPSRGEAIANVSLKDAGTDVLAGGIGIPALFFTLNIPDGRLSFGSEVILNPNVGGASQAINSDSLNVPLTATSGVLRVSAVPEPTATALLSFVALVSLIRCRRRNQLVAAMCSYRGSNGT